MNEILLARLDQIDSALSGLVESFSKFTPSQGAAQELVIADGELTNDLEKLNVHQNNYERIDKLRGRVEALESRLGTTVGRLRELQEKLMEGEPRLSQRTGETVDLDDLLLYARTISRFTIPPRFDDTKGGGGVEKECGLAWELLPDNQKAWLNQGQQAAFFPWPSDDNIKTSGLGALKFCKGTIAGITGEAVKFTKFVGNAKSKDGQRKGGEGEREIGEQEPGEKDTSVIENQGDDLQGEYHEQVHEPLLEKTVITGKEAHETQIITNKEEDAMELDSFPLTSGRGVGAAELMQRKESILNEFDESFDLYDSE